jgi:D-glycero-D-manno-heptose 1,7-bisphosphate phosphatase
VRPAVFLDRDGTINARAAEHDYIREPRDFRWLAGALEGMVRIARTGLPLVVVSNQRGVSRGLVAPATLRAIEGLIQDAMETHGCRVDAFRYCLHDLGAGCECRKPQPGLLRSAAGDMQLDLGRSWMIGDGDEDVEAGQAAGCHTIQLTTGSSAAERTAPSLLDAAPIVLEGVGSTAWKR